MTLSSVLLCGWDPLASAASGISVSILMSWSASDVTQAPHLQTNRHESVFDVPEVPHLQHNHIEHE